MLHGECAWQTARQRLPLTQFRSWIPHKRHSDSYRQRFQEESLVEPFCFQCRLTNAAAHLCRLLDTNLQFWSEARPARSAQLRTREIMLSKA